ncbi:hypothetical protein B0H11DRAFT_1953923 [Mycena galericulata]|nr:hypothetical protein B0H11DRAFT_1953923 [Mycena galericulata]
MSLVPPPRVFLCANCKAERPNMLCTRCMVIRVCSKECMRGFWPYHKKYCQEHTHSKLALEEEHQPGWIFAVWVSMWSPAMTVWMTIGMMPELRRNREFLRNNSGIVLVGERTGTKSRWDDSLMQKFEIISATIIPNAEMEAAVRKLGTGARVHLSWFDGAAASVKLSPTTSVDALLAQTAPTSENAAMGQTGLLWGVLRVAIVRMRKDVVVLRRDLRNVDSEVLRLASDDTSGPALSVHWPKGLQADVHAGDVGGYDRFLQAARQMLV